MKSRKVAKPAKSSPMKFAVIGIVIVVVLVGALLALRGGGGGGGGVGGAGEVSLSGKPSGSITAGSKAKASVTLSSQKPGTYTVPYVVLDAQGNKVKEGEVEISFAEAGENSISVDLSNLPPGTYTVKMCGDQFSVELIPPKPATFIVVSLVVPKEEIPTTQSIKVKAVIRNVGDLDGTFENTVVVGSVSKPIFPVPIPAGAEKEVEVTITSQELESLLGGKDKVQVDVKLCENKTPLKLRKPTPAQLEYLALSVPAKAYVNEGYYVEVLVKNVGDLTGDLQAQATVGGQPQTKTLSLKGGQEYSWKLGPFQAQQTGNVEVKAGDFVKTITVVEPPPVVVDSLDAPAAIYVYDEVSVKIVLKNRTGQSARADVTVLVSGPEDKSASITDEVPAGQTEEVFKKFRLNKKGIYTVTAETKSITVRALSASEIGVPGDVYVTRTNYNIEIPLIGYSSKSTYLTRVVYTGIEDYMGYPCQHWAITSPDNPQFREDAYCYLSPDEKTLSQVSMTHDDGTNKTVTVFSPPAKNWEYPPVNFEGDWVGYSQTLTTVYGGSEYTILLKGRARFRLEILGEELYLSAWGEQLTVMHVKLTLDLQDLDISVMGLTGKGSGTMVLERWLGPAGSLREKSDSSLTFTVGGMTTSLNISYVSDMLCYKMYWASRGKPAGDPTYFQYL